MSEALILLAVSAATLGFVHTLLGPDHYIPFIAMAKARNWSVRRTAVITILCGLVHVGSSVVLGFLGIGFGLALARLEWFESTRAQIAGWLLIAFGLVYLVWGIRTAIRNRPHTHRHVHADGTVHEHHHAHQQEHLHPHDRPAKANITPWVLFTVFIFGPCEPLIPLLMYPAAQQSHAGLLLVTGLFALTTIGTMLGLVLLGHYGIKWLPMKTAERYMHALAGFVILLCGVGIQFLGL